MTTKNKTATDKGRGKKLKVRKETIKDLEVKKKGTQIKGGVITAATMMNPKHPGRCY